MKFMLDFHYSDFWADPGKEVLPKAWFNLSSKRLEQSVYNYTRKVLSDFKKNGIDIGMVQVGNEITNGMLGIVSDRDHGGNYAETWDNDNKARTVCRYLEAGSKAVRSTYDRATIAMHLETPNIDKYRDIMTKLRDNGVEYDVLGTSYYPFWSTKDNNGNLGIGANTPTMLEAVQKLAKDEFGKRVVVLETGWTSTLDDSDGTGNLLVQVPIPTHTRLDLKDKSMSLTTCIKPWSMETDLVPFIGNPHGFL